MFSREACTAVRPLGGADDEPDGRTEADEGDGSEEECRRELLGESAPEEPERRKRRRRARFEDGFEDRDEGAGSSAPRESGSGSAGRSAPAEVEEEGGRRAGSTAPAEEDEECKVCNEEEEEEEFQRIKKKVRPPVEVSREEIEEHELLSHTQYRSWCRHCVAARAVGQAHRVLHEDHRHAEVAEIVMDYYFLGEENETVPHLVVKDRKSSAYFSTALDSKTSPYALAFLTGLIRELGYKRIILKSDMSIPS
jgi:hypothetical protein